MKATGGRIFLMFVAMMALLSVSVCAQHTREPGQPLTHGGYTTGPSKKMIEGEKLERFSPVLNTNDTTSEIRPKGIRCFYSLVSLSLMKPDTLLKTLITCKWVIDSEY